MVLWHCKEKSGRAEPRLAFLWGRLCYSLCGYDEEEEEDDNDPNTIPSTVNIPFHRVTEAEELATLLLLFRQV